MNIMKVYSVLLLSTIITSCGGEASIESIDISELSQGGAQGGGSIGGACVSACLDQYTTDMGAAWSTFGQCALSFSPEDTQPYLDCVNETNPNGFASWTLLMKCADSGPVEFTSTCGDTFQKNGKKAMEKRVSCIEDCFE